jgi:hypothetical protein
MKHIRVLLRPGMHSCQVHVCENSEHQLRYRGLGKPSLYMHSDSNQNYQPANGDCGVINCHALWLEFALLALINRLPSGLSFALAVDPRYKIPL